MKISKPGEKADVPVGVIVGSVFAGLLLLALAVGLLWKVSVCLHFCEKHYNIKRNISELNIFTHLHIFIDSFFLHNCCNLCKCCLLFSLAFSKESTSSFRKRQRKTGRVTHMSMKCCELKRKSSLSTGLYPVWILVLLTGSFEGQMEPSHWNEMEAVQFVDNLDWILCPFYRELLLVFFFCFF